MTQNTTPKTPSIPAVDRAAPCSAVWDQYFCTALLAQMSSQTLHDEPHLWQPYQAELSAEMADVMMSERGKRFPPMSDHAIVHGTNCKKAQHEERGGYLHAEDDDSPYYVDGLAYCGRCHHWMPPPNTSDVKQ